MMSDSPLIQADDSALQNVLLAFAEIFPEPTDDQTHALAGLLGFDKQELVELAQKLLAPLLDGDEHSDVAPGDPKEVFLLAFYLVNTEPSEEQLEVLALLMELDLDELESLTYSVIHKLTEKTDDNSDTSLNGLDDNFMEDDEDDFDVPLTDGDGTVIQLI